MKTFIDNGNDLSPAISLLRAGEVVAIPTETVYGLAADALNSDSILKIFKAKERPLFDPLIVHVAQSRLSKDSPLLSLHQQGLINLQAISPPLRDSWVRSIDALLSRFWPGPLTVVLPRGPLIPDLITSGLDTVAIRSPAHPVAQALLEQSGLNLAAPSANRFGRISPTSAQDVFEELGGKIPLIIDGGSSQVGLESTILHVHANGTATLLRPGGVSVTDLKPFISTIATNPAFNGGARGATVAPGMLPSHYAPRKPLALLDFSKPLIEQITGAIQKRPLLNPIGPTPALRLGFFVFNRTHTDLIIKQWEQLPERTPFHVTEIISPPHNLSEPAIQSWISQNLFSTLRHLDSSAADFLFSEEIQTPDGLYHAIADRLTRASYFQH